MNRKITDIVLFFCFCILFGTGVLLYFAPKGIDWHAIGAHEDFWKYTHIAAGIIMLIGVIAHLAINRKWIDKALTGGRRRIWVALLAIGILLAAIPSFAPISAEEPKGEQARLRTGNPLNGQNASVESHR